MDSILGVCTDGPEDGLPCKSWMKPVGIFSWLLLCSKGTGDDKFTDLRDRPRGSRLRSTGIQRIPEFRQLVHGISLSHFTFRLVHPSQLNLAVEAIWVRDTFRIPFAFMSAGSPGVERMRLESGKFQLGW